MNTKGKNLANIAREINLGPMEIVSGSKKKYENKEINNAMRELEKKGISPKDFYARLLIQGVSISDIVQYDTLSKKDTTRTVYDVREPMFQQWAERTLPVKYRNVYQGNSLYSKALSQWLSGKNIFLAGSFQIGKTRLGLELLHQGYLQGRYGNLLFTSPASSSLKKNDEIIMDLTSRRSYGIVLADLIEPRLPNWQLRDYFRVLKTILETNHQVFIDTNNSNPDAIREIWGQKIYYRLTDSEQFFFLWDESAEKLKSLKVDIRKVKI